MDVQHRKKYRDPPPWLRPEAKLRRWNRGADGHDLAVRRSDHHPGPHRGNPLRITKEVQTEQAEGRADHRQPCANCQAYQHDQRATDQKGAARRMRRCEDEPD